MLHICIGIVCGVIGYILGKRVTYSKLNRTYNKLKPQSLIDDLISKEVSRRENQKS